MNFKRGFLNTSKARDARPSKAASTPQTKAAPFRVASAELGSEEPLRASFGTVEERGQPKGYTAVRSNLVTMDPNTVHPDENMIVTRLPAQAGDDEATFCLVSGYIKKQAISAPSYPQPLEVSPLGPAYRISAMPGKGLGMFATRKLRMGDLVADERALLIVPAAVPVSIQAQIELSTEQYKQAALFEQEKVLQPILDMLTPERQKAFFALHNSHKLDGSGPIMGVIRTNGFGLGGNMVEKDTPGAAGQYSGIWENLSRINHSCSPNVCRNWTPESFSMQVRAARDIEEGEEITIQYTEIMWPYERRKADLLPYEVNCLCSACKDATQSDARRARFMNRDPISPPFGPTRSVAAEDAWIQPAITMLREMEEEGVQAHPAYGSVLHQIVNAYISLGDDKAAVYGKKLYAAKLALGDNPEIHKMYTDIQTLKAKLGLMFGMSKLMGGRVFTSFA